MVRHYNASRRKQAAEETRNRILQAALKLHWEGVTEYGPLAREAGCSVPTVRKHFPTKEALFQNCTRTFGESLVLPDLDALGRIAPPTERLEQAVTELCRVHEAMFGYAWTSACRREDSPALDSAMKGYEGLADAIAGIIAAEDPGQGPVIRGFLDFLTYRALRLSGKLTPDRARKELIRTLRLLVPGDGSTASSTPPKGKR